MATTPFSGDQLIAAVRGALDALRAKSFDQLVDLPPASGVAYSDGPRPADLWTYAERDQDRVRIVVQVCSDDAVGSAWSQVHAEGFRRWSDGRTESLRAPEIYEFM